MTAFLVAPVAIGIVIVILIIGIVTMNDASTAFSGGVIIIVAALAERHIVRACVVVKPDPFAAVLASDGFVVVAIGAKQFALHFIVVLGVKFSATAAANEAGVFGFVVHSWFLLKSVFFCQKHSGVGFVVNDENLCRDRVVCAKFERALVGRLFLRVGNVLGFAVG